MKHMSLKHKLGMIFGVLFLLSIATAYESLTGIRGTNMATADIATNWLPSIKLVNAINTATSDFRIAEGAHIMSTTEPEMSKAESDMKSRDDFISETQKAYEPLISSDDERKTYELFKTEWSKYLGLHKKLLDLSRVNQHEEAAKLFKGDMRAPFDSASDYLVKLIEINNQGADQSYNDSQSEYITTLTMMGVILVLSVGTLVAAVLFSIRGISKPIENIASSMENLASGNVETTIPFQDRADEIGTMAKAVEGFRQAAIQKLDLEKAEQEARAERYAERAKRETADAEAIARLKAATSSLAGALQRLAGGDLSFQIEEQFAPEFEPLRIDLNRSVEQLRETLASIAVNVSSIDGSSHEISNGANDLSKRTEQQAAALEETAAALDEITANVSSSSKRADEARSVAAQANASATKSGQVVSEAVTAMSRIEESSNKISNIIGVIDEIAFQTNLLALNAGVEAARAGDAGRGFAVVAQEVRELAQRSASAAKEIKGLINQSKIEVNAGVKLVSETGEALKTIEEYIISINQHMEAIATSTREQSVGLGEVNTAVNQMDQTTQKNAAMVEETTAASTALAGDAANLQQKISQFNLGHSTRQTNAVASLKKVAQEMAPSTPNRAMRTAVPRTHGNVAVAKEEWSEF